MSELKPPANRKATAQIAELRLSARDGSLEASIINEQDWETDMEFRARDSLDA
jgi:hypothetical protein